MARFLASAALVASAAALPAAAPGYALRAQQVADFLAECTFSTLTGTFPLEQLWQSGQTLSTLADVSVATGNTNRYAGVFAAAFSQTPVIVDNCYDDHQWWEIAWITAYKLTNNTAYLQRAAEIFDYVTEHGWNDTLCGGTVVWCPLPQNPYPNAITAELFLTSAALLHPYTALLGKPAGYYLNWALREWEWISRPGGVWNAQGLINDGLNLDTCTNNGAQEWSYNQGVLLDGLALLSQYTGNSTFLQAAARIGGATMSLQADANGILQETCNGASCDADQHLFKGIWARHWGQMLPLATNASGFFPRAAAFIMNNADSVLANDSCLVTGTGGNIGGGLYGLQWAGPCSNNDAATGSAAMDLFVAASAAARLTGAETGEDWLPLGAGNCADSNGNSMPNCYQSNVPENTCKAVASADPAAVAYDYDLNCDGLTFCRVRTLSPASACPSGWGYSGGSATAVNATTGDALTLCLVRATTLA